MSVSSRPTIPQSAVRGKAAMPAAWEERAGEPDGGGWMGGGTLSRTGFRFRIYQSDLQPRRSEQARDGGCW